MLLVLILITSKSIVIKENGALYGAPIYRHYKAT